MRRLRSDQILLIDDTRATREAVSRLLEDRGYFSIEAADGRQAAAALAEGAPDLIVLDMQISSTENYDVLELLNANPKYREVPVVVLTGVCDTLTVRCIDCQGANRRRLVRAAFSVREMLQQICELTEPSYSRINLAAASPN